MLLLSTFQLVTGHTVLQQNVLFLSIDMGFSLVVEDSQVEQTTNPQHLSNLG